MLTAPPTPRVTVDRLEMTLPGAKFRLETTGLRLEPYGYMVSRLFAVPATSVRFSTTAVAVAGIGSVTDSPVTPVSCSFSVAPGPKVGLVEHWTQVPVRVSRMRKGGTVV